MSPQEIDLMTKECHIPGCGANSSFVVVYSAKQSKDGEKYHRWLNILGLLEKSPVLYACQRHFPAGAPTKSNPDPNPKLFNPIPKMRSHSDTSCNSISVSILDQPSEERVLEVDGNPLPDAICPPPGAILKLAPNATLIDLKKIKEKQDLSKPIRIEEVTVMIDEKDTVRVIDYGPMDPFSKAMDSKFRRDGKTKRRSLLPNSWDDSGIINNFMELGNEPNFQDFQDTSLGIALERMRRLRIDCNAAIIDVQQRKTVYAHRAVLVARSPYFYRQMYLKRKKYKCLSEFCRFTLPIETDFEVVEAVISYFYTGTLNTLLGKKPSLVRELFSLFEMKEALDIFNQELANRESEAQKLKKRIKLEPMEEESVIVLPFDDEDGATPVIDVDGRPDFERKRKKRTADQDPSEDFSGKLKVSVQKIVDNALNPILGKIEELFDPASTTLQIVKTSQHIITLWNADILLTKLFDQNELSKFFSQVMTGILEKSSLHVKAEDMDHSSDSNGFTVETLFSHSENSIMEDSYTKPYVGGTLDQPLDQPIQTLTVGDMQIINYNQLSPKHISMYAHMIAMYRYNILMKKKHPKDEGNEEGKNSLIPSLLGGDVLNADSSSSPNDIHDLVKRITQEEPYLNYNAEPVSQSCFQQVNSDLKKRVVSDLEMYVNPSFHEELIMHIIVNQMDDKNILPLSLGIFLAKGCNFCKKKECKAEDLTMPVSPDNPVCPDRQCIKRNLQCDICNKQMSTSKSLARHRYSVHDIETGETAGSFICSHCGETFSKKWKLNIHEREHEDRKMELMCSYCKKKIRGTIALKKHIAMVHEAKPQYSCEFCSKSFKRRETLSVHRRIHTGEKPFQCYHCSYASETKGNLKAHIIRKHKLQFVSYNPHSAEHHHIIPTEQTHVINDQAHVIAEDTDTPTTEDQVMAATIVAHSLSDGSFIITSDTPPNSIVR